MSRPTRTPRPSLDHDLYVPRPAELIEARTLVVADSVAASYVRLGMALHDRPGRVADQLAHRAYYAAAAEVRMLLALDRAAAEHRERLAAMTGRRLRVVGGER